MSPRPRTVAAANRRRGGQWARRILCATDFSRASRAAFLKAMALAEQNRTTLTLLHVLPPATPREDLVGISEGMYQALRETESRLSRRHLSKLVALTQDCGIKTTAVLAWGYPDREILSQAHDRRSGLVVVGAHGATDSHGMGSVAERVMRFAPMPVLVVRDVKKGGAKIRPGTRGGRKLK